ncbi:MFS transporter [Priestia megaterium]|uniref:MFS transporter n=1 Tax=Priestia megaterium TaxID=1404 RepID=UPI00221E71E9|nr:MFS transporter [Priestia megaterium]
MTISTKQWQYALFTLFLVPGLSLSTWISRTPNIRDTLLASTSLMGWIIFGLACGSLIGLLTANRLIGRLGTKSVIAMCLFVICIGLATIGISSTFFKSALLVFLSLVFFGFGFGMIEVAINVEGASLEHAMSKTLLPALHGAFSAGTLLGAGIGYLAILLNIATIVHFLLIALLGLLLLVIYIGKIPSHNGKTDQSENVDCQDEKVNVWKEKRTILIGLLVLGMAFAEGSANEWLPMTIVDGFNVEDHVGTAVYTIFLFAMLIGRLAGGNILDRFGRVPVIRFATLVAACGICMLVFVKSLLIGVIGVFLWGLGASLGFPVGLSAAGDEPKNTTQRVGAVSVLGYLAFLVGPPFLGILGEAVGLLRAMIAVLITLLLVSFLTPAVKKTITHGITK